MYIFDSFDVHVHVLVYSRLGAVDSGDFEKTVAGIINKHGHTKRMWGLLFYQQLELEHLMDGKQRRNL